MSNVVELRDMCIDTRHLLAVWFTTPFGERIIYVKPSNDAPQHGEPITVLGSLAIVGTDNRKLEVIAT